MNTLRNVRKAPVAKSMGIEIECILVKECVSDWHGFFYKGYDGSINSKNNWRDEECEFVSQPLTYEWMHRELKKLYKTLDSHEAYTNSSCGIHIHVSKLWCSDKKAKAIWEFIKTMPLVDFEDIFGRQPNHYCDVVGNWGDRYIAVNSQNKHTNEFRMFKSSNDVRWALYCVDCVKYMVENAYTLNLSAFSAFRDQPKYRGII